MRWVWAAVLGLSAIAGGEPSAWVEARVTSTLQLFQQALLPGLPGVTTRVEPAAPFTLMGATRFGGLSAFGGEGTMSGELSTWGRLGPLDSTLADGDVTAAWVQYERSWLRVRLGRQLVLPGSSRYVRFDGATLTASLLQHGEVQVYAGWVALPRWSLPRGAVLAGFATDALLDGTLTEAQNRAGQLALGARVAARASRWRTALSFHEQRDALGTAFRVFSADAFAAPTDWIDVSGRLSLDARALSISEARLWVDARTPWLPISVDYAFQNAALLLPQTSILAAFGGQSWHEVAIETTARLLQSLRLTGRASTQWFDGERLGGRASLKATWTPDREQRVVTVLELGRALVPPSGFIFARLAARGRVTNEVSVSADAAVYTYDVPIRGQGASLTGTASVEWQLMPQLRALGSITAMTTPYSVAELQGLARLSFDLEPVLVGRRP